MHSAACLVHTPRWHGRSQHSADYSPLHPCPGSCTSASQMPLAAHPCPGTCNSGLQTLLAAQHRLCHQPAASSAGNSKVETYTLGIIFPVRQQLSPTIPAGHRLLCSSQLCLVQNSAALPCPAVRRLHSSMHRWAQHCFVSSSLILHRTAVTVSSPCLPLSSWHISILPEL